VKCILTRRTMTNYLSEIVGEIEVWITEAPCHTTHFNAERFLDPYKYRQIGKAG
jgi:hypothetical protein